MGPLQFILALIWVVAIIVLGARGAYVASALLAVVLVAVLLIDGFPAIKLRLARRKTQQRTSAGQCIYCGYSLRGNRSERCPECGKQAQ